MKKFGEDASMDVNFGGCQEQRSMNTRECSDYSAESVTNSEIKDI